MAGGGSAAAIGAASSGDFGAGGVTGAGAGVGAAATFDSTGALPSFLKICIPPMIKPSAARPYTIPRNAAASGLGVGVALCVAPPPIAPVVAAPFGALPMRSFDRHSSRTSVGKCSAMAGKK
jgi:hypothetical protein